MKHFLNLLIIFSLFIFVSCGKKSDTSTAKDSDKKTESTEKKDSKSDESKSDKDVTLGDLGITEGLPKNFPSDIPQPGNAKCLGSLNSSEGSLVTFESKEKVADLAEYYKTELKKNGYELKEGGDIMVSGEAAMLGWKKGDKEVSIVITWDKEKSQSSFVITYK
jgi:hypothetical protein